MAEDLLFESSVIETRPIIHAYWKAITIHNGETPDYDCVCSNCEHSGVPYGKFCPECGALMDGKENKDEID